MEDPIIGNRPCQEVLDGLLASLLKTGGRRKGIFGTVMQKKTVHKARGFGMRAQLCDVYTRGACNALKLAHEMV
jgi:hypothetical protein